MIFLSATKFFSDIFEWFASLSTKLPAIDFKTYFIVVVSLLIGIGLIVALTFIGSYRFKLMVACRKIIHYLSGVDAIDNDNFGDFTAQCFSSKVPSTLRDCWVQYLGVRFGYPSDIVSEQNVYDKEVKRVREIRANVYIAIALVLIAIFSFWGYGRLDGKDMGVIFLASLLLSGVIYLALVILNRALSNQCLYVFNNMQEDLDAKVVFQVEKSFATDSSPLADLSAIIDEIVARNTAKEIGFEFADEQTPIEELIANSSDGHSDEGDGHSSEGHGSETYEDGESSAEDIAENSDENKDVAKGESESISDSENETGHESENVSIDDILSEEETEGLKEDALDGVIEGEICEEESEPTVAEAEEQSSTDIKAEEQSEIVIEVEPVETVEETVVNDNNEEPVEAVGEDVIKDGDGKAVEAVEEPEVKDDDKKSEVKDGEEQPDFVESSDIDENSAVNENSADDEVVKQESLDESETDFEL